MGAKKTITAASLVHDGHPVATQAVPSDFAWQRDSMGSETQTMYFHLDNGCVGFVQVAWAYMALTTVQTNALFYVPGQPCVFETFNGHGLDVSKDSFSYKCKGLAVAWSADHTKMTVKYTAGRERDAKGTSVAFEFVRTSDGYKIGDAKNHIGSGTAAHYFYPAGQVTAAGEVGGTAFEASGVGMFVHAHSANIMPYNVGAEWNMAFFKGHREDQPEDQRTPANASTFHVLQYRTPDSCGAVSCSNAGLTENSGLRAVLWDTVLDHHDLVKDPSGSGYEIPSRSVFSSKGATTDGRPATVVFEAKPAQRLQEIDVLDSMPRVVRRLVQALITKPFIFQRYEADARVRVEIEGEAPYTLVGVAFHEHTKMG